MTTPGPNHATTSPSSETPETSAEETAPGVPQGLLGMIANGAKMAMPASPGGAALTTDLLQAIQTISGNQVVQAWVHEALGRTDDADAAESAPPAPAPIDQLRTGAEGNWYGDVDEAAMLELIRFMGPEERAAVVADTAIMTHLAGAFDLDQMLDLLFMLPLELKWRAHWLRVATLLAEVPSGQWITWFSEAPDGQVAEFFGWTDLARAVTATLTIRPDLLLIAQAIRGTYGQLIASQPSLAQWIIDQNAAEPWLDAIASFWIADGDIPGIVATMRTLHAWDVYLSQLPRGTPLSASNRASLRRLAGALPMPDCGRLFGIRFNTQIVDSPTVAWIAEDVRAVWDPLALLPDQDVTDNTALHMFTAIAGDAATWSGGTGSVNLGQGLRTSANADGTPNPDRMLHTVRHEIGHAVHTEQASTINSWLQNEVGFWYYDEGEAGVRSVITDLGGFPAQWRDKHDATVPFSATEQARVVELLVAHSGHGAWVAETTLPDTTTIARDSTLPEGAAEAPGEHDAMLWEAMPQSIRDCFDLSKSYWYHNYASFPIGAKGRTFWNHWYAKGYYFSATAKAAIDVMHDDYTAMSEKEFFANCYAEFFRDPAGYNDHSRWGGGLDASIQAFMRSHVLERQPYTPPTPAAGATVPPAANPTPPEPTGAGGVPRPQ